MTAGPRMKPVALAAGLLMACQGGASPVESPENAAAQGPVQIELGAVTDGEGRVTMPRTVFGPADTVRLSLGRIAGADTVAVRWVRVDGDEPGVAVDSAAQVPDSAGSFSFAASPRSGWSPGRYAAEVSIGGRQAGAASFEVR